MDTEVKVPARGDSAEVKPGAGLAGKGKAGPAGAVTAPQRSFDLRGKWEAADFFLAGDRSGESQQW